MLSTNLTGWRAADSKFAFLRSFASRITYIYHSKGTFVIVKTRRAVQPASWHTLEWTTLVCTFHGHIISSQGRFDVHEHDTASMRSNLIEDLAVSVAMRLCNTAHVS